MCTITYTPVFCLLRKIKILLNSPTFQIQRPITMGIFPLSVEIREIFVGFQRFVAMGCVTQQGLRLVLFIKNNASSLSGACFLARSQLTGYRRRRATLTNLTPPEKNHTIYALSQQKHPCYIVYDIYANIMYYHVLYVYTYLLAK